MDRGDPERQLVVAYEFAASAYGWTPARIAAELTDELLVDLFDAASDRLDDEQRNRIEAARLGTLFAHNAKAYRRWAGASRRRGRTTSLTGQALERAVAGLAFAGGASVITETIPAAVMAERRAAAAATPLIRWEGPRGMVRG